MAFTGMRGAVLAMAAALTVGGCAYDDYGYGGVSVGAGGGGYYGYDDYYDGYGYPSYGWYDGYYYPGNGYYIYDRGGRRHRWRDSDRRHWEGRRHSNRGNWDRNGDGRPDRGGNWDRNGDGRPDRGGNGDRTNDGRPDRGGNWDRNGDGRPDRGGTIDRNGDGRPDRGQWQGGGRNRPDGPQGQRRAAPRDRAPQGAVTIPTPPSQQRGWQGREQRQERATPAPNRSGGEGRRSRWGRND